MGKAAFGKKGKKRNFLLPHIHQHSRSCFDCCLFFWSSGFQADKRVDVINHSLDLRKEINEMAKRYIQMGANRRDGLADCRHHGPQRQ